MFSFRVLLYGPSELELIVISLLSGKCSNLSNLCLEVFYRPPSSSSDILILSVTVYFPLTIPSFPILYCWVTSMLNTNHPFYSKILELMDSFAFSQIVTPPTHISSNSDSSLIDLVCVSNMLHLCQCHILPQLANSDHYGLMVTMKHSPEQHTPITRRRYKHADFEKANNLLMSIDLDSVIDASDI